MRFIMPHGGYGLGNDLIPWAKAFILGHELGATVLHPAWGNNPRRYSEYFATSRWDSQLYRILIHSLPHIRFDEKTWREIGEPDFSLACARFADLHNLRQRRNYIVSITGLWGAFAGIESARHFVRGQLLATKYTQRNLHAVSRRIGREQLTVGIHVRRTDFSSGEGSTYEGAWNTALPLAWYQAICRNLIQRLSRDRIQFIVTSDGKKEEVAALIEEFGATYPSELDHSVCSDLLLLADADLFVGSLSTYSMWAAFLSNSRYVWFRGHLSSCDAGLYMRNLRALGLREPDHPVDSIRATPRGVPVDLDGRISDELFNDLERTLARKSRQSDLVRGGAMQCPVIGLVRDADERSVSMRNS